MGVRQEIWDLEVEVGAVFKAGRLKEGYDSQASRPASTSRQNS